MGPPMMPPSALPATKDKPTSATKSEHPCPALDMARAQFCVRVLRYFQLSFIRLTVLLTMAAFVYGPPDTDLSRKCLLCGRFAGVYVLQKAPVMPSLRR